MKTIRSLSPADQSRRREENVKWNLVFKSFYSTNPETGADSPDWAVKNVVDSAINVVIGRPNFETDENDQPRTREAQLELMRDMLEKAAVLKGIPNNPHAIFAAIEEGLKVEPEGNTLTSGDITQAHLREE